MTDARTRPGWTTLGALLALLLALTLLPAAWVPAQAEPEADPEMPPADPVCDPEDALAPGEVVPAPAVDGPISGGVRTGEPYAASLIELPDGWVEEEFFIDGTARDLRQDPPSTADYTTRILVRRPTDPAAFNGTVVLDWTNVTVPDDTDVNWISMHHTILERGYAYVAVAAQRLGVEVSPLALKQWDPVRYGELSHPGDDFSFDIFSQAAQAVLDEQVMGALTPCIQQRLGVGASQSAGRLKTYINAFHEHSEVFDGLMPQISGPTGVRTDLVPVLWLNSQHEIGDAEPMEDTDLFRLWEMAGPAHAPNDYSLYTNATVAKAHTNGLVDLYDADAAADWGYRQRPGLCVTRNYFQAGPYYSLALVALDDWVRTGEPPAPMPRAERDENGRVWDEHGNLRGGMRSPLLEVPIATYYSGGVPSALNPCGAVGGRTPLTGTTEVFSAAKLAGLYESGEDYLTAFTVAVDTALDDGFLLPESADWLLERAEEAAAFVDDAIG
jgi:hypothetical protein